MSSAFAISRETRSCTSKMSSIAADGIGGPGSGQHLQRHGAAEPEVAGAVHVSHAARAEQRDDFVMTEASAGRESHERVILAHGGPASCR